MTFRKCYPRTRYLGLTLLLALGACNADDNDDAEASGGAGEADAGESAGSGGSAGGSAGASAGAGAEGPSFRDDIHPLLVASCNGCHADMVMSGPPRPGGPVEGGANAPGKFAVDDPEAAYPAILPYVHAGDPDTSTLYIKISQDTPSTGGQRMPPALRQWDDAAIAAVGEWIAAGAANN